MTTDADAVRKVYEAEAEKLRKELEENAKVISDLIHEIIKEAEEEE